jgi:hypothetical protein
MPTSDSGAAPPNGNVLRLAIVCTTFVIVIDLIGAALIRLNGYDPIVFGDISKVGIGILGGVVMDRAGIAYAERRRSE